MKPGNPIDSPTRGSRLFTWSWYFQPSWGQATIVCAAIGLIFMSCAGRETIKKRDQLRSWPAVTAHVDSATIVTPQQRREAVYAARYWLSFPWQGAVHKTVTRPSVYSGGYRSRWRQMESAKRSGTIAALVNPQDPDDPKLDAGWNGSFFLVPLILGTVGLFFCGLAALFYWLGRRFGMAKFAAGFVSAPSTYGVWIGLIMGFGFLGMGGFALYLRIHQKAMWRRIDARVDSADVVRQSSRSGTTYGPRFWLSYTYNDTLFHAPVGQSWSTSNYRAQAQRAADVARVGHLSVLLNPREPLDLVAEPPGRVDLVSVLIWAFFTVLCFGLAFLFHRLSRREPDSADHGAWVR